MALTSTYDLLPRKYSIKQYYRVLKPKVSSSIFFKVMDVSRYAKCDKLESVPFRGEGSQENYEDDEFDDELDEDDETDVIEINSIGFTHY